MRKFWRSFHNSMNVLGASKLCIKNGIKCQFYVLLQLNNNNNKTEDSGSVKCVLGDVVLNRGGGSLCWEGWGRHPKGAGVRAEVLLRAPGLGKL